MDLLLHALTSARPSPATQTQAVLTVRHAETNATIRFAMDWSDGAAAAVTPYAVELRFAKAFRVERFALEPQLREALRLREDAYLVLTPATSLSPAAVVDPFWACERTSLPQSEGIAASWFWPKALTGNTHPGASLPHGYVSVVAYSGAYPTGYGVNAHSTKGAPASLLDDVKAGFPPYQYTATGFAHLQPSGTGSIGTYMNFVKVMPLTSARTAAEWVRDGGAPDVRFKTWLEKERSVIVGERASPGYYAATLARTMVRGEVTTMDGAALHRYTFPLSPPSGGGSSGLGGGVLAIELSAAGLASEAGTGVQRIVGLNATLSADNTSITLILRTPPAYGDVKHSGVLLFVHIHCRSCAAVEEGDSGLMFWPPALSKKRAVQLDAISIAALGGSVGVALSVNSPNGEGDGASSAPAEITVGFSLRSSADAEASCNAAAAQSFDAAAAASWRAWNTALGRINVLDDAAGRPGALRERSLFYSTLFHALRKPSDWTGHVPVSWETTESGATAEGYVFDVSTSWDQYKTTLPLLLTVYGDTVGTHILNGFLNVARRYGTFPTGYTLDTFTTRFDGQARGLAHITLADGLHRGVGRTTDDDAAAVDWRDALRLMQRTFSNTSEGRMYVTNGSTVGAKLPTHTLDLSAACLATSAVASAVNESAISNLFLELSANWINVYNASDCMMLQQQGLQYYEGTYMNYGFRQQVDMVKRIALCAANGSNGTAAFTARLERFFGFSDAADTTASESTPVREAVVQMPIIAGGGDPNVAAFNVLYSNGEASHSFEDLCNEPDMETPFSFAYVGRFDRLAEVVTAVKLTSFSPGRGGLAGNDDSGGESAWFVWASIGLWPIAGQPIYILGVPSFNAVSVEIPALSSSSSSSSTSFRIERQGTGAYVESVSLDGNALGGRGWLWVHEVSAGGVLVFSMGRVPSTSGYGSIPPPSYSAAVA